MIKQKMDNLNEVEMKTIYNNLNEENQNILNMVAKGMQVAQENKKEGQIKNVWSNTYGRR